MIKPGQHFITCKNFSKEEILEILNDILEYDAGDPKTFDDNVMKKKMVANLFYEPSTRTNSSFYAAEKYLGHEVLNINNVIYSSVSKGESLEDTILTLQNYVDCIVLRHPETGAAHRAARISSIPIINAGDGIGEHPTQTLLDLYTIFKKFKTIDGLNLILMGDLKYGRTIHGLISVLHLFNTNIKLVSPASLKLPVEYHREEDEIFTDLNHDILENSDVLYLTRVQKERGAIMSAGTYSFNEDDALSLNANAIVMHPLPRLEELPTWFDSDPRAKYFEQMKNGLVVRKYLLEKILK
jgi:aspartate carbamoyltransferase catalytic subunit